jgi:tartrate dehydratase alpha subunit/fumarate hydratase class I-like protein
LGKQKNYINNYNAKREIKALKQKYISRACVLKGGGDQNS